MDHSAVSVSTFLNGRINLLVLFSEQDWCQGQLTKKLLKTRHKICRPLTTAFYGALIVQGHDLTLSQHLEFRNYLFFISLML